MAGFLRKKSKSNGPPNDAPIAQRIVSGPMSLSPVRRDSASFTGSRTHLPQPPSPERRRTTNPNPPPSAFSYDFSTRHPLPAQQALPQDKPLPSSDPFRRSSSVRAPQPATKPLPSTHRSSFQAQSTPSAPPQLNLDFDVQGRQSPLIDLPPEIALYQEFSDALLYNTLPDPVLNSKPTGQQPRNASISSPSSPPPISSSSSPLPPPDQKNRSRLPGNNNNMGVHISTARQQQHHDLFPSTLKDFRVSLRSPPAPSSSSVSSPPNEKRFAPLPPQPPPPTTPMPIPVPVPIPVPAAPQKQQTPSTRQKALPLVPQNHPPSRRGTPPLQQRQQHPHNTLVRRNYTATAARPSTAPTNSPPPPPGMTMTINKPLIFTAMGAPTPNHHTVLRPVSHIPDTHPAMMQQYQHPRQAYNLSPPPPIEYSRLPSQRQQPFNPNQQRQRKTSPPGVLATSTGLNGSNTTSTFTSAPPAPPAAITTITAASPSSSPSTTLAPAAAAAAHPHNRLQTHTPPPPRIRTPAQSIPTEAVDSVYNPDMSFSPSQEHLTTGFATASGLTIPDTSSISVTVTGAAASAPAITTTPATTALPNGKIHPGSGSNSRPITPMLPLGNATITPTTTTMTTTKTISHANGKLDLDSSSGGGDGSAPRSPFFDNVDPFAKPDGVKVVSSSNANKIDAKTKTRKKHRTKESKASVAVSTLEEVEARRPSEDKEASSYVPPTPDKTGKEEPTSSHEQQSPPAAEEEKEEVVPSKPWLVTLTDFVAHSELLKMLLEYLTFYDWCTLASVSRTIRIVMVQKREAREQILERFLRTVGYTRWGWEDPEPLSLSLQDLSDYMRGVSTPTHEYARNANMYVQSLSIHPNHRDPAILETVRALTASARAYTRVVLRLRAQAEKELAVYNANWRKNAGKMVRLPQPATAMSQASSRAPSPTSSFSHSHSQNHPSQQQQQQQQQHQPQQPQGITFKSPLFRMRRAPLLRVFVPSPEGDWLSDKSVLECEAECKRAGVTGLLRMGDVIWDIAVGDEGNVGRLVWDGSYLIDLDYTYSPIGELPKYMPALAFSPSYFHRVIRTGSTNSNPVVHMDISMWGEEIAANLQLLQDRVRTETPQGAYHNVVRWVHRSSFVIRPRNNDRVRRVPIPGTDGLFVDQGWYGTVVVETEGTNESLADLQERCGPGVFPQRVRAGLVTQTQAENRKVFRILREKSRPGEIWIRCVSVKERLL